MSPKYNNPHKRVSDMRLVYEHRTNGMKLVDGGQSIMTNTQLAMILSRNPAVHMATKTITPGKTSFSVYKADLTQLSGLTALREGTTAKGTKGKKRAKKAAKAKAESKRDSEKAIENSVLSGDEQTRSETPWMVFLGHEWEGHDFDEVTILYLETPTSDAELCC